MRKQGEKEADLVPCPRCDGSGTTVLKGRRRILDKDLPKCSLCFGLGQVTRERAIRGTRNVD